MTKGADDIPPELVLEHPALVGAPGCGDAGEISALPRLFEAHLVDQQRLAVVLQAAALLGHLEHRGLRLAANGGESPRESPWQAARLDGDGVLRGLEARPGRLAGLPQSLLLDLLVRLFGGGSDARADAAAPGGRGLVAGRGVARRVARELAEVWSQELEPQCPDAAVGRIVDAAPFLWQPAFAPARRTLASGPRPWLVGPGPPRRRFLRRAAAADSAAVELADLLAGRGARDLWEGLEGDEDPSEELARGRLRRAAAAWRRRSRRSRRETLDYARCLADLGRYAAAVGVLRRRRDLGDDLEAALLLARCQRHLGERGAAEKTIAPWQRRVLENEDSEEPMPPGVRVRLAEIAVRLAAKRGDRERARSWIRHLLGLSSELENDADAGKDAARARIEALLTATEGAFDLGEPAAMADYLGEARAALDSMADDDPSKGRLESWWSHAEGLRRMGLGDGSGAVEHVSRALRRRRRRLSPARAGRLWNDLAVARSLADDLPGAERACRHALRLLSRIEGPARLTLALFNLAEVRLRRGRLRGVAGTLERSTAENRRLGNHRGLLQDLELWVRLELAQGRAAAALARVAEARRLIAEGAPGRGPIFDLLAARAHGWLDDPAAAARSLESEEEETLSHLEPEERPAVFALARRFDAALEQAHGTPWSPLWQALAADEHPPTVAWDSFDALEPFRAARLVLDAETVLPGVAPPLRLRRAIDAFRRFGAEPFAEILERRSASPWLALRRYLEEPVRGPEAVARLLAAAGHPEARLAWRPSGEDAEPAAEPAEEPSEEYLLVDGAGGRRTLETAVAGGDLHLSAESTDGVLEALFALLAREAADEARDGAEKRLLTPSATTAKAAEDDDVFRYDQIGLRDGIVGRSTALRRALERLDRLAGRDLPLLVLGESGTGKELAARRIHRKSRRHGDPFVPINCAALSESLIQSDLFGHVRGSFTGAERDRAGVFEAARGGTVFLDEIGDLPLASQGKLLRVLQEGEIRRVGESFARKVDVRVIAATHRDLAEMVEEGQFRQDLYYRLRVAKVELPPLRERGDDLLLVAEHLLRHIPAGPTELTPAARRRLRSYQWPGNVRELRNILEVASALSDGVVVDVEHLDLPAEDGDVASAAAGSPAAGTLHQQLEAVRRRAISDALERSEGNQAEAARLLGVTRQTLSYHVKQLGL